MHGPPPTPRSTYHRRRLVVAGVIGALVVGTVAGVAAFTDGSAEEPQIEVSGGVLIPLGEGEAGDGEWVELTDVDLSGDDVVGDEPQAAARADGGCTIGALQVQMGKSGEGVECLQDALAARGLYDGESHGDFDDATHRAVVEYQRTNDMYVDGVVGRETAVGLEIWPDEEDLVVRTPRPPEGAEDLWGVELSPVGSAGDDAPPLPEDSGSGYRVVYDRAGQRVWAVDDSERIIRSWLVSGSTYANERPGTHYVYSRSELSTAWNGKAYLPLMIRYQKTDLGNIGFHGIPTSVRDGTVYQTTDELGTRLSGGCQRQHNLDAMFLWGFAPVGTKIVVT